MNTPAKAVITPQRQTKMGATESKLRCLFLPAQSGKTRKVQEEIRRYKEICHLKSTRSLDILISANNRLLVYQTTSHMKKDLGSADADTDSDTASVDTEDPTAIADTEAAEETEISNATIEGAIFSWTSGSSSNISTEALTLQILRNQIEMVVLCANRRRLNYLAEMLRAIAEIPTIVPREINIWIDEADSSIGYWRTYTQILALPVVTRVTLVSATFDSVLRRYESLRVIPYKDTHPPVYRRLRHCTRQVIPRPRELGTEEYIVQVLCGKDHARLTAPGQRAFIPGDFTKESHAMIAKVLGALGFVVVLLNGERKELLIPGQAPIDLRAHLTVSDPDMIPEEFNQTLAKLYTDLNLARFPLAITGYLCIRRGVTFQCPPTDTHGGFVFDYGIIPPIRQAAEAYQMTARLFGNVGAFPNYTAPPTIYTDKGTFDRIEREEEAAVNLPRMVHEEGLTEVTKADFERARRANEITEIGFESYTSMEDLVDGWRLLYLQKKGVLPPTTPKTPGKDSEGAYKCAIDGGDSCKQQASAVRDFLEDSTAKKSAKNWGSGITTASPGDMVHRVYVGYEDTDPIFFLRWAIKGGDDAAASGDVISYA